MKRITYCYVDGEGEEQVKNVSNVEGGNVGYTVDEHMARIWMQMGEESETNIFPLRRIVFIREITSVIS